MFFIFPYRIRRPFKMPWVTLGIMGVCLVVFALQLAMGLERSFALLGFRPDAAGIVTWFTAMFAHAGVMHLAGNLYFLWLFGGVLEDTIGRSRYLLLYIAGGLVAALFHALMMLIFARNQLMIPSVGASGAIAAVMGLSAVRFSRLKLDVWYCLFMLVFIKSGTFSIPAFTGVILFVAREVWGGLSSLAFGSTSVAHWAHVGGALFGIAAAYGFGLGKDLNREEAEREAASWAAVGRMDVAQERLLSSSGDQVSVSLTRARQALGAYIPDAAAAGVDVRSALRALIAAGRRSEVADVYLEFKPQMESPLFLDAQTLAAVANACETLGRYDIAAHAYYSLLRHFPGATEAERALFRLAHVYLAQGRAIEADKTWATFRRVFPASPWLGHADERFRAFA